MLEATGLACFFDLLNKSAAIPNLNTNFTVLTLSHIEGFTDYSEIPPLNLPKGLGRLQASKSMTKCQSLSQWVLSN